MNVFVSYLVGEEGTDNVQKTCYEVVALDNMPRNRGSREELESEIFDGGLGFAINEKVGIYDPVVYVGKMSSCRELMV